MKKGLQIDGGGIMVAKTVRLARPDERVNAKERESRLVDSSVTCLNVRAEKIDCGPCAQEDFPGGVTTPSPGRAPRPRPGQLMLFWSVADQTRKVGRRYGCWPADAGSGPAIERQQHMSQQQWDAAGRRATALDLIRFQDKISEIAVWIAVRQARRRSSPLASARRRRERQGVVQPMTPLACFRVRLV
ncbi:uncharacterized protein BDZ99DRAFT_530771 [Mytilinidion resinicola]|uniref:Uncharacterized protein n=1 Tax=Mytilinidion resinicola TaxID=574789 RepID=A0A6A6Z9I3_9PEZI|nr:uncharacterized protein BDZ99DRAFT_530771 [Mytilinidion resinicola]KAF2817690.1 hypothetical protein BDZ99DRAFT_530771 [Mytilinidion resinicola]